MVVLEIYIKPYKTVFIDEFQYSDYGGKNLKYINFLEKTFVFQRMTPFYKNKRIELVKNPKIYCIDNGLRNSLINDFRKIDLRVDRGTLLENFHFSEFIKMNISPKFWRTKSGAEVDFIIEQYDKYIPIEIKSFINKKDLKPASSFKSFLSKYKPKQCFIYNNNIHKNVGEIYYLPHWLSFHNYLSK